MRGVFGLRYYAFLLTLVICRRCSGKQNTYSVMALDGDDCLSGTSFATKNRLIILLHFSTIKLRAKT